MRMKTFCRAAALLFLTITAVHAATQNLTVRWNGRSVMAGPATYSSDGGGTVLFTTYDGSTGAPLEGNNPNVSLELSPVSGSSQYRCDFINYNNSYGKITTGRIIFNIPSTDADNNGIPDVFQINESASNVSYSGTAYPEWDKFGDKASISISGKINRTAGSSTGTMHGSFSSNGETTHFNCPLRLLSNQAVDSYTVGQTSGSFPLSIPMQYDASHSDTYTGNLTYTVVDEDTINCAAFTITSGSKSITYNATTFTRYGNIYRATIITNDGFPYTSWADYKEHVVELIDNNDSDGDGIPDRTDQTNNSLPNLAYVAEECTLTLPSENNILSTTIPVENNGTVASDSTSMHVYFTKTKDVNDTSNILFQEKTLPSLAPGSKTSLTFSGDVSSVLTESGDYYVLFWIDPDNAVEETIEDTADSNDNIAAFAQSFTYTLDTNPPFAPANVTATNGTNTDTVSISWSASAHADSYTVYRAECSDSSTATVLGNSSGTSFADVTAKIGFTYYYWVKAANIYGSSDFSGSDYGYLQVVDIDGNGIDDNWEALNLGSTGNSPSQDSDNDGITDYEEYISGLDPTVQNAATRVLPLYPGWNMISIPDNLVDASPDSLFSSRAIGSVWVWDAKNQRYKNPEGAQSDMTAFWIYVLRETSLVFELNE